MAGGRHGAVLRQIEHLFGGGTATGTAEGDLLERFLARRDQAAFEALVARHGPMVLGVCRRILADPHDIEDAFQATFLILVRKARAIRDRELLGPWLYGVARRVANRARADASRRRTRERSGAEEAAMESPGVRDPDELRAVLDEELGRLPEKYRAPLVLCYLEGLTHDEAALRLRCPVGTVRSRMTRARETLRPGFPAAAWRRRPRSWGRPWPPRPPRPLCHRSCRRRRSGPRWMSRPVTPSPGRSRRARPPSRNVS